MSKLTDAIFREIEKQLLAATPYCGCDIEVDARLREAVLDVVARTRDCHDLSGDWNQTIATIEKQIEECAKQQQEMPR